MLKLEDKLVLVDRLRQLGFDPAQLQPLQANINGRMRQLAEVSDPARDADGQLHFSATWQNGTQSPERVFWHELSRATQIRVTSLPLCYFSCMYRFPHSSQSYETSTPSTQFVVCAVE